MMPRVDVYLVDPDGDRCPYAASVEMEVGEDGLPIGSIELVFRVAGLPKESSTTQVSWVAYEFCNRTIAVCFDHPKQVICNGDEVKVTINSKINVSAS